MRPRVFDDDDPTLRPLRRAEDEAEIASSTSWVERRRRVEDSTDPLRSDHVSGLDAGREGGDEVRGTDR